MNFILDILKGIVIGIANIIPGVSGGTMMVSMGIFDNIIFCITHIFKQFKKSITLLAPYLIGMLIGIGAGAIVLKAMFANYPLQTNTLFIGLILGGLPAIVKNLDKTKINAIGLGFGILFFALAILLQFASGGVQKVILPSIANAIIMLALGGIASATMVIPGVSGSMVLKILGYYEAVLNSLVNLMKGFSSLNIGMIANELAILLPFALGVVLGIFFVSKLLEYLLKKYFTKTYCAILGLVLSSPVVILMGVGLQGINFVSIITSVLTFVIGFFIAHKLSGDSKSELKANN